MVFGLFSRKSTVDDASASPDARTNDQTARLPTPTPSVASVAQHSPLRFSTTLRAVLGGSTTDLTLNDADLATESVAEHRLSPAPPPPETPSPPPPGPHETKALYDMMLTIPPKTLHTYTLAHLCPPPLLSTSSPIPGSHPDTTPLPPSPTTVAKLTTFFATLAPPPLLHCVRCHKDFYDIENEEKDKACRVHHDDESALVSRISGGGYETLWGCCGQTAPGDGSEGPPDGWCYEGRHTVDIKRARFRADATMHDDKLTSCLKLNCRGIRDHLPRPSPSAHVGSSSGRKSNPSPVRSQASVLLSRSSRKRPRTSTKEASSSENEADAESSPGHTAKAKPKETTRGGAAKDAPTPPSKPKSKVKSMAISRARPPLSTSPTASLPASGAPKARTATTKPKSTSRTLLSQSQMHIASDSEASTRSRPRTRSHVREESRARDASRSRPGSRLIKGDISERTRRARKANKLLSQSSGEEPEAETDEYRESEQEMRGRDRKKRRVGRD